MLRRNTDLIQDVETRLAVEHILQEGFGNPIALSAVPTATIPLLEANSWGMYNGIIYIRRADTIYVVTPSSTITVT